VREEVYAFANKRKGRSWDEGEEEEAEYRRTIK